MQVKKFTGLCGQPGSPHSANFMAPGQCNCSNYFTVERQAVGTCPAPSRRNSRSRLSMAFAPARIFHPALLDWFTFGGNVYRTKERWRGLGKREMQLNRSGRGIIMHKCLHLSLLSGFPCSDTDIEGRKANAEFPNLLITPYRAFEADVWETQAKLLEFE